MTNEINNVVSVSIEEVIENAEKISYQKVKKLCNENNYKIVENEKLGTTYIIYIGCCAYLCFKIKNKWHCY